MRHNLKSDSYRRTALEKRATREPRSLWPLAGFLLVAVALLGLSRVGHPFAQALQTAGLEITAPAIRGFSHLAEPFVTASRRVRSINALVEENDRLVAENQRLRGYEGRVRDLEARLKALEALARTAEAPALDFVTARVIASSSGPFVRSVLIDAGRDNGIKAGHPVLSADGVAGRIVAAGRRVSRVLLTVDFNSRIPALVGADQERVVMEGDNTPLARLSYRSANSGIRPGDVVVTSGVGGLFPRGLRLGRVVDTGDLLRIEPATRFERADYLSVVLFESPAATLAGMETNSAIDLSAEQAPIPGPEAVRSGKGGGR